MSQNLKTCDIPLISSIHGEERRMQRDISKRDLQSAVKYGIKERGFPCPRTFRPRWKYTFAGIVYITDETSTLEVTSWAEELPFEEVPLSPTIIHAHEEGRKRIKANPHLVTSHTILVIDMSASMKNSDMNGHRSRVRGTYYALANQFLKGSLYPLEQNQNFGPNYSYTDVVTLIEFHTEPEIIFELEPFSWTLYNDMVKLADGKRASSHGCYYEAIMAAFNVIRKYRYSDKCAYNIFFMSDGKASDGCVNKYAHSSFPNNMYDYIEFACKTLRGQITFNTYGFGKSESDFDVLRQMVAYAKRGGAQNADFGFSYENDNMLRSMLDLSQVSMTKLRTMLTRLNAIPNLSAGSVRERVNVGKLPPSELEKAPVNLVNYDIYLPHQAYAIRRLERRYVEEPWYGEMTYKPILSETQFQHPDAVGFAVSKQFFGEGAERIVFLFTEVNYLGAVVGEMKVAKSSLYKQTKHFENEEQQLDYVKQWHHTFLNVQHKAANIAKNFNNRLNELQVDKSVPRLMFLACSIYECEKISDKQKATTLNTRSTDVYPNDAVYLVERKLRPEQYRKWNDNVGGVDGIAQENTIKEVEEMLQFASIGVYNPVPPPKNPVALNVIVEEDEDDDNDYYEEAQRSRTVVQPTAQVGANEETRALQRKILPGDIPQAFSHFSHIFTQRKLLICDIQGELQYDQELCGPIYRCTDPSIHTNENIFRKKQRYGKTDHGIKGITEFYKTHQCNSVCELLRMSSRIVYK